MHCSDILYMITCSTCICTCILHNLLIKPQVFYNWCTTNRALSYVQNLCGDYQCNWTWSWAIVRSFELKGWKGYDMLTAKEENKQASFVCTFKIKLSLIISCMISAHVICFFFQSCLKYNFSIQYSCVLCTYVQQQSPAGRVNTF